MNKKPITKEKEFLFGKRNDEFTGCAIIVEKKEDLTKQPQWKAIVSNFNKALNAKYPLKTKAIKPQGYKVK
jgi:hypothetical protein